MSLSLSSQDIAVLKQSFFLTFWRSEASLVPFVRVPPYESRLVQKSNLNNKVKSTISCMWAKDGQVGSGRGSKQPILVTKLPRNLSFSSLPTFFVQLPRMASSVYTSSLLYISRSFSPGLSRLEVWQQRPPPLQSSSIASAMVLWSYESYSVLVLIFVT